MGNYALVAMVAFVALLVSIVFGVDENTCLPRPVSPDSGRITDPVDPVQNIFRDFSCISWVNLISELLFFSLVEFVPFLGCVAFF